MKSKIVFSSILLIFLFLFLFQPTKEIKYRGFGWYGYLADDELNEKSIEVIKNLGGNSVNINIYYEYDPKNKTFILISNLTLLKEKIELAHRHKLKVFLSPFVNLVGGHYLANKIKEPKVFLEKAKNASIEIAKFAEENKVELYAIWNELGLSFLEKGNSTEIVNKWLQEVREKVRKHYRGEITTKEGVQLGLYEKYNFSGFDYIGVTFYPFTTSFAIHPYSNISYKGVENLKEYESVVEKEFKKLEELKKKFNNKGIILGEIGIDVVGGKFIGEDEESNRIRAKAYEIILREGLGKVDGFFFSKFEYGKGGSKELDEIFKGFFLS